MPIHVFCDGCRDFVRIIDLTIVEEYEIMEGLQVRRTICKHCNYEEWKVDDWREDLEDDVLA